MKKKYTAAAVNLGKKAVKKSIIGTVFECATCKEAGVTTRFIAGKKGMDPLFARVVKHASDKSHGMYVPINPKPGMVFDGLCSMPYKKGDDPREWYDSVVQAGGRMPLWNLVKV